MHSRRRIARFSIFQAKLFSRKRLPHSLRTASTLLFALLLWLAALAQGKDEREDRTRWVGSWAASQQLVEPRNALSFEDLRDATLRQIVHLSLGGTEIRLRLSNRFGNTPLYVTAVHVAKPVSAGSDKIVPASDKLLTFSGSPDLIIPAHAEYLSDPVSFPADALSDVAITLHVDVAPAAQTGHPGSRTTTYFKRGNLTSATELPGAKTVEHWYFIAGIDVDAPPDAEAVVVVGDSITDGRGSTTNGNDRWTDVLARRLQARPDSRKIAVLNHGIGGNRLLTDGLGPNALSRFDHDVIAQPGVRYLVVLEGINDIGMLTRGGAVPRAEHDQLVQQMIGAYQQMIARARTHGIKVIGATIMPFAGTEVYHPGPASEADRQAVNQWIRAPGHFDAVIDFDKITRNPEHPERLAPAFDSGDHLHPSPAGYAAMAEAVPLSLFEVSAEPPPKIAITFDDLPAHGPLPPGETRLDVISKIIAALRKANLPPIYGFVNGARLQGEPDSVGVLEAWHSAGNPLANHSWSHMNLNQHSLEDFEADVMRNEPLLAGIMKGEDWHWFRYPFLAEGDTPEKRAGFRNFLRERGQKIAAVTMSFGDYLWNEPYARCKTKGDAAGIATLENTYLAAAEESVEYYRGLSHTLYQRDIPYVLLMHVGAFDAELLPRLLQLYRGQGFEFVTLPEAERDQFYGGATDLSRPPDPATLEDAMKGRGLALPARTNFAPQLDAVCR
jgi:lysophospholipase L1-like esterase